ncbi:MAG: tRNA (N6-isopentenyl adenosine(37)-C2)-methylthiotransferase MiaB [Deltaproteobacteria bacterium]|nr:tRNA (N6-isopentenyl adenosine(37)-C2)-methylthiotransferase MiaB [Deltaproteobacteria bacterium]
MNVADSELMAGVFAGEGFVAAASAEEADVVLLNTCAVRDKAEDRIFGRLGWLKPLKDRRPELVLGVAGCMAEHLRETIVKRAPWVDLVVGPDAYRRLPALVDQTLAEERDPTIDVRLDRRELYAGVDPVRAPGVSGWVTILRGCDKFCTFCIVPFTRGRERSVPPDEVVRQAEQMAAGGFREVTLLGQTVTSYDADGCDFAELLARVHAVPGLARIRYTSPWPKDFSPRLLDALAELPRVARHIHLPVQSGSSRVLADMRRGYTADEFLALVERIRERLPGHALTTDLIVGYPGETDADFEETLELVRRVGFDSAFTFKYSQRDGTLAARERPDDVPEEVKGERLTRLIKLQEQSCRARNEAMVGQAVEVLVDGPNPRDAAQMVGRTSCFKTAVLPGGPARGELVTARVVAATTHTLFAQPV